MRELTTWLDRQSRRREKAVLLEDALIGGKAWPYTWYRLRFFFARYVVASAVHVVKVLLLFELFSLQDFLAVLLFQAGAGLVGGFWWGSLEVLRGRVRDLSRSGRPHLIPKEIGRWLSFALRSGIAVASVGLVWVVWRVETGSFGPADLYVVSVFVRLAVELVTRCYHSGVYAIRRIYRPMPTIVGIEFVTFAGILGLWPVIGAWSIAAASLLSTAVGAFLLVHYTGRTYRYLNLSPAPHVRLRSREWPMRRDFGEWLSAGASYALMRLDALLVLAMFGVSLTTDGSVQVAVLFFLLSPTLRSGFEWAQLFYFDLKRLEEGPMAAIRERFDRHVMKVAVLLAGLFWIVASVAGTVFYRRSLGDLYVVLLPMLLARSLLASAQIRAYADRAYGRMLVVGAAATGGLIAAGAFLDGEKARVLGVAVVLGAAATALFAVSARRREAEGGRVLPLADWIDRVGTTSGSVRVGGLELGVGPEWRDDPDQHRWLAENRWRHDQFASALARRVGRRGAVARVTQSRLVWFERGSGAPALSTKWILARGGGRVEWINGADAPLPPAQALAQARTAGLLGEWSRGVRRRGRGPSEGDSGRAFGVEVAREAFSAAVPRGWFYIPGSEPPEEMRALDSDARRSILHDALAFGRDIRPRRRSSFDVTGLYEGGELRMIFVIPPSVPGSVRRRWRETVRSMTLDSAVAGALSSES